MFGCNFDTDITAFYIVVKNVYVFSAVDIDSSGARFIIVCCVL